MATILQVGKKWQARIRKPGFPSKSQNFPTKSEAVAWAKTTEADMITRKIKPGLSTAGIRIAHVIDQYIDEAVQIKQLIALKEGKTIPSGNQLSTPDTSESPFGKNKKFTLARLKRTIGDSLIKSVDEPFLLKFIKMRMAEAGGVTIGMDLGEIKSLLQFGRRVLHLSLDSTVVDDARAHFPRLGLNPKSEERTRMPTDAEVALLNEHYANKKRQKIPVPTLIDFARKTAMRLEEVTTLRWADLNEDDKTILIRDRKDPKNKKGNDQTVPLLADAMAIVLSRPRTSDRIFPYKAASVSSVFPRAVQACGIEDLHFHDFRHEGTTRLFEDGYRIEEVAVFTGHRTWTQLKRYTHIKAKRLHLDRYGNPRRVVPSLANDLED